MKADERFHISKKVPKKDPNVLPVGSGDKIVKIVKSK